MSAMSAISVEFNAQLFVSEQLTRQLINTTQDVTIRCIQALAAHYGFDQDEAIRMVGLNMLKLERKAPVKTKGPKVAKVVAPKAAFPLPYNGEFNDACCYALRQNNGLYTQCTGVRKGEAQFCKSCASQMQKTGAEVPEYGTIQQRMAVGIFEYVDPKGRKPVSYAKVMKKYKITQESALEEAGKLNIVINPEHFVVAEETKRGRPKSEKAPKEKGAKGRPKKSKKVLQIEGDDEDLFATLVAEANESDSEVSSSKKKGKTEEEKEAERLAKEAEKAEKEAKRLAEKAEKEAKAAAEKEAKRQAAEQARLEKEAKKKAEEEEKAAKKAALEQAKLEKEAKLAAEKAAKEAAKSSKKAPAKAKEAEPEEDEEPDVVKKIEYEGKKYLKSKKTGIVYDYTKYVKEGDQVVIGKWNDATNKIDFTDEEEDEEEYDL